MRNKPSTNEFYRAVLDNALREQWVIQKPDVHRAKQERSRRLSSLYGYNMSSAVVRERMGRRARPKGGARSEEAARRAMSPYRDEFRELHASRSAPGIAFKPSAGLLGASDELDTLLESSKQSVDGEPLSPVSSSDEGASQHDPEVAADRRSSAHQRPHRAAPQQQRSAAKSGAHGAAGDLAVPPSAPLLDRSTHDMNAHLVVDQPWYAGYQNSANVPPGAVIERYGHSGALNVTRTAMGLTSKSVDYRITSLTLRHSLPRFLGEDRVVDTYAPPVFGAPRAWPHKANYVTGSKLKAAEPTPELPKRLKTYLRRLNDDVDHLNKRITEERSETIARRAEATRSCHRIHLDASTGRPAREHNKLINEGKRMRYWAGSTAVCAREDDEVALAKTLARERENSLRMQELKWSESFYLYKLLRSMSMQFKPGLEEFRSLFFDLRAAAAAMHAGGSVVLSSDKGTANGLKSPPPPGAIAGTTPAGQSSASSEGKLTLEGATIVDRAGSSGEAGDMSGDSGGGEGEEHVRPSVAELRRSSSTFEVEEDMIILSRDVFVNVLGGHFEHADRRRINKLYSGFDPFRVDQVDYRLVMVLQRCFWRISETPLEKLHALLAVMDQHAQTGVLSEADVEQVFTVCSIFDEERDRIRTHLHDARPFFQSFTVYSAPGYIALEELERMLRMYGPADQHPLVLEFASQMRQRLQLFLIGNGSADADIPSGAQAGNGVASGAVPPLGQSDLERQHTVALPSTRPSNNIPASQRSVMTHLHQ